MRKPILVSLTISGVLAAAWPPGAPAQAAARASRGSLARRLNTLLDRPPFNRVTWGVSIVDERGRALYERNADRLFVPASNTKLVVSAAATVLLPADFRVRTSVYVNGALQDGVLDGDLVLYGRGDPTFSERCYGLDTLAPGACDSAFTAIDAIADSVRARGVRRVTGHVVGDGSWFEPLLVHPAWNTFDLNWWYAAPVSGLGFHDNSVDFLITPSDSVDRPPAITWTPDLGLFTFENRARTSPTGSRSTIGDNFFRTPGTMAIWAEGTAARGRRPWTESFALPDPNHYAARALAVALERLGITVEGGATSTTDSLAYRAARASGTPLVEYLGRPLGDIVFPILNTSQNWFAEMLLLSMNGLNSLGLSYGWAIIVITVIIKILFWPLTNMSTRSMKRMASTGLGSRARRWRCHSRGLGAADVNRRPDSRVDGNRLAFGEANPIARGVILVC